jgi:hypothetical protein
MGVLAPAKTAYDAMVICEPGSIAKDLEQAWRSPKIGSFK